MPNINIGILGGGQLARMSAFEAIRMGYSVSIMEKNENSPAGMLTKNEYVGWVDDIDLLKKFTNSCDVVTLENEFIDADILKQIEDMGKEVIPSSGTIRKIQDKLIQKETLSSAGLPVAGFVEVTAEDSYKSISDKLGEKFLLKSRKMGYDGYGNHTVCDEDSYLRGLTKLKTRESALMAESFVNFSKELAVMVVRTTNQTETYPVVETIQKNHICSTVIAPAEVSDDIKSKAAQIAKDAVRAVDGFGIYGVEMFLGENGEILINEMAPRPHNSGHYTIEGCEVSQFENHIRAVLDLPIGSTRLVKPYAVMTNLLGKRKGEGYPLNYSEVLEDGDVHLHIYGKENSRPGRKMGHITVIGDELETVLQKAENAEKITDL